MNSWNEIEAEFDRNFKHVHHPLIHAENVIHDTKPIKEFLRENLDKAYLRGREEGRDSGENRILAALRHHEIDYSEAIKTRREWDKAAKDSPLKETT